jgi:alanyl-tRNA synthetase
MQRFKNQFSDEKFQSTFGNIQKCLRLNDLMEVGDGTHYLDFEMIGLFSFREWTVKESIDFFMLFLTKININPDYVTIHPDKISEWSVYYEGYDIEVRIDKECLWSDGNIGGYCTEFFKNNIEIGNIVNPLGNCIDVGFGLERLLIVHNEQIDTNRLEILEKCFQTIVDSGIKLGHNKESYVLKKIITTCLMEGSTNNHPYFLITKQKMLTNYVLYLKDKEILRLKNKGSDYWKSSYGIDENYLHVYERFLKESS